MFTYLFNKINYIVKIKRSKITVRYAIKKRTKTNISMMSKSVAMVCNRRLQSAINKDYRSLRQLITLIMLVIGV